MLILLFKSSHTFGIIIWVCVDSLTVYVCFVCRSLVGAGLSQFKSDTLKFQLPFFERFRNTEDR